MLRAWLRRGVVLVMAVLAGHSSPRAQGGASAQLQALVRGARQDINAFWASQVPNYRPPADVVMVQAPMDTDCGRFDQPNATYCTSTNKIYWDLALFTAQLRLGDFAPVFILAHEWGHLVQRQLGFRPSADGFLVIQLELQADCLAGTYAASARSRKVMDEGDDDEAVLALRRAGDDLDDPWFDREAHGSSGQRIDAFSYGLAGRSCLGDPFFAFLKEKGIDPARVPATPAPSRGRLDGLLPKQAGRFALATVKRVQIQGANDALTGVYRSNDGAEVEFGLYALPTQAEAQSARDAVVVKIKERGFRETRRVAVVDSRNNNAPLGQAVFLTGAREVVVWSNAAIMILVDGPAELASELYNALPF